MLRRVPAIAASTPSRSSGLVPSCAEGGVLGILPGAIGTIQATETVKLILGIGEPLIGRLLLYDALGMSFREMKLRKDPDCPVCGENPTVTELIDYQEFCGIPQANATQEENGVPEISVRDLKSKLDNGEDINVLDVREPHEYEVANIGMRLLPLGELPQRLAELDQDEYFVVHCKTGGRSARAVKLLQEAGFQNVYTSRAASRLERGDRPERAEVLGRLQATGLRHQVLWRGRFGGSAFCRRRQTGLRPVTYGRRHRFEPFALSHVLQLFATAVPEHEHSLESRVFEARFRRL